MSSDGADPAPQDDGSFMTVTMMTGSGRGRDDVPKPASLISL
jgi:hypothetical protein